jgi:hypothetical protein
MLAQEGRHLRRVAIGGAVDHQDVRHFPTYWCWRV